jgi:hypothetical protein
MLETLIICGAGIVSGKEIMALELGKGLTRVGVWFTSSLVFGTIAIFLSD